MDNLNVFTGLLTEEFTELFNNNGETFLLGTLYSYGADIPVVMSEYFANAYAGKRVACTAYMVKTRRMFGESRKTFTYLNCIFIESYTEEGDNRYAKLEGTIRDLREPILSCNNKLMSNFKLECSVALSPPVTAIVTCRAFSKMARETLCLSAGDEVKVSGYLVGGKHDLRVVVKEITKVEEKIKYG